MGKIITIQIGFDASFATKVEEDTEDAEGVVVEVGAMPILPITHTLPMRNTEVIALFTILQTMYGSRLEKAQGAMYAALRISRAIDAALSENMRIYERVISEKSHVTPEEEKRMRDNVKFVEESRKSVNKALNQAGELVES